MESWKRRYGLSREEYLRMHEDQEGTCFICGEEKSFMWIITTEQIKFARFSVMNVTASWDIRERTP